MAIILVIIMCYRIRYCYSSERKKRYSEIVPKKSYILLEDISMRFYIYFSKIFYPWDYRLSDRVSGTNTQRNNSEDVAGGFLACIAFRASL